MSQVGLGFDKKECEMKIKVSLPVICEGKYDKIKLSSIIEGDIFTLEGFSVFRDKEKRALISSLAKDRGIIVLTDSDSAGMQLRGYIKSFCPKDKVYDLYAPRIKGKEKRKTK